MFEKMKTIKKFFVGLGVGIIPLIGVAAELAKTPEGMALLSSLAAPGTAGATTVGLVLAGINAWKHHKKIGR